MRKSVIDFRLAEIGDESWRTSTMMGWDAKGEKMVPAHTLSLSHEPDAAV